MKKLTLILSLLFTALTLFAQKESCDDISKVTSELTETTYFKSNAVWMDKNTCLSVFKMITPKMNSMALTFTNYSNTLSTNLKGVYLKFDDRTFYRNPDIKIDVEVNEGGSRWKYKALLVLNKDKIDTFKSKKIIGINFGFSGDLTLSSENYNTLNNYIICVDDSK